MRLIPIYTWNKSIKKFENKTVKLSNQPWSQGVLLLLCVVLAMLLANLPFTKVFYRDFLETSLQFHCTSPDGRIDLLFPRDMTVEKFINDILMVIFFFTVGLEIKREISHGELSSPKKALLPVIAAFGGVIAPALIYTFINHGTAAASGWGIPTATDIAFAVCILSVLGDKRNRVAPAAIHLDAADVRNRPLDENELSRCRLLLRPHGHRLQVDVACHVTRHHLADADVRQLPLHDGHVVRLLHERDARLTVEVQLRRHGRIRRVHARRTRDNAEVAVLRIDEERICPNVSALTRMRIRLRTISMRIP